MRTQPLAQAAAAFSVLCSCTLTGAGDHSSGLTGTFETIIQEVVLDEDTDGIVNLTFPLQQFDDRDGQRVLESVTLELLNSSTSFDVEIENNDIVPLEAMVFGGGIQGLAVGNLDVFAGGQPEGIGAVQLGPSDGVLGTGPDYLATTLQFAFPPLSEERLDNLGEFVGVGTIEASYVSSLGAGVSVSGDAVSSTSFNTSGVTVRLTYSYRESILQLAKEVHTNSFDVAGPVSSPDIFDIPRFDSFNGTRTLTAVSVELAYSTIADEVTVENLSMTPLTFSIRHEGALLAAIGPLVAESATDLRRVTPLLSEATKPTFGGPDFLEFGDFIAAGEGDLTTFDSAALSMFENADLTLVVDGTTSFVQGVGGVARIVAADDHFVGEVSVSYFYLDPSILSDASDAGSLIASAVAQGTGDLGGTADAQGHELDDLVILLDDPLPNTQGLLDIRINPGPNPDGTIGNLTTTQILAVGNDPSAVTLGDFNSDTALDIAVANRGTVDNSIWVFMNDNDGSGMFTSPPLIITVPASDLVEGLAAADLNEDGLDDLALASGGADAIRLFINTLASPGTFSAPITVVTGLLPTDVCPIDDDNDKDLDVDLAVLVRGDQQVILIDYDTDTGMASVIGPPTDVGPGADGLATADFDLNGSGDVLVTNGGNSTMSILLANVDGAGVGVFEPAFIAPVDGTPRSPVADDLDGDGDADVAIVSDDGSDGPAAQVFENGLGQDGPGVFVLRPPLISALNNEPQLLTAGELNGDNQRDLIVIERIDPGSSTVFGPTGSDALILLLTNLPCLGDVAPDHGDGTFGDDDVDIDDLLAVIDGFGPCPEGMVCPADVAPFGGNDTVNIDDLLTVIDNFGPCE